MLDVIFWILNSIYPGTEMCVVCFDFKSPYIFLESVHDEGLQLAQALVDARSSPLLHDGFGGLETKNNR